MLDLAIRHALCSFHHKQSTFPALQQCWEMPNQGRFSSFWHLSGRDIFTAVPISVAARNCPLNVQRVRRGITEDQPALNREQSCQHFSNLISKYRPSTSNLKEHPHHSIKDCSSSDCDFKNALETKFQSLLQENCFQAGSDPTSVHSYCRIGNRIRSILSEGIAESARINQSELKNTL